jgi:hypothetical protein
MDDICFSSPLCSFVSFVIQGLRPAQAYENRFFDLVVKGFPITAMSAMTRDPGDRHATRATSLCLCPSASPTPPAIFSSFIANKDTYSNRPLGLPCATLAWPLGHPWATQGPPNPKSAEGGMLLIYSITKLPIYPILLEHRRNPAISCLLIFQGAFGDLTPGAHLMIACRVERIKHEIVQYNARNLLAGPMALFHWSEPPDHPQ